MTKINSQVHFFINEAVDVKRHNAMAFFRAETGKYQTVILEFSYQFKHTHMNTLKGMPWKLWN